MTTGRDRRSFLRDATLAALGLAAGPRALGALGGVGAGSPGPDGRPSAGGRAASGLARRELRVLVLGGTGFIGPHMVRYAHERGHRVSIFNRGNRQPDLPADVEWLVGDRNDDLTALEGREWDVVFDNHTTLPRWVRDTGSVMEERTGRYVFVSTLSVYADNATAWADESAPLAAYTGADPFAEERVTGALYGPLKARSEEEVRRCFDDRATVVRPGLIVGPGDPTDRFTYWPVRIDRGGEVLAPSADDPVQFIDARDLTAWIVRLAENDTPGTFNATGPADPLATGEMLRGIRSAIEADATFTHVPADFLEEEGVRPWSDLPVWIPHGPGAEGFSRRSIDRALSEGLTFRPLPETVRETLAWRRAAADGGAIELRTGLAPEREAQLLAAWKERAPSPVR